MGLRGLIVAVGFLAASLLDVPGPAPLLTQGMAARLPPGSAVVQGTIAWTSGDGTDILLKDGRRLLVPDGVNVSRAALTPPHSIKAYVRDENGRTVVTLIEIQALHPGGGGGIAG
jgi:hypothetical protein